MLSFLKYDIEYGELLLEDNFDGTEPIENKWEIGGGEWVKSNGLLRGEIRENRGGLIYSRQNISGDLIMDFTGKLIPPCDNDLNFTFRASGWNHEKNMDLHREVDSHRIDVTGWRFFLSTTQKGPCVCLIFDNLAYRFTF